METITVQHIYDLSVSRAIDPALVRYDDGALEVRSLIEHSGDRDRPYTVVTERDGLYDLDEDWDGGEMDDDMASQIADCLNAA